MSAYADFSIPKLKLLVKGCDLESGWLTMGRVLKVLGHKANPAKHKEILTEIEISDRTAAYLVAIVTRLDAQIIKVPQGIGWRKMAEVAPVITYDNQAIIFSKVLSHTREDLIEMRKNRTLTNPGKSI